MKPTCQTPGGGVNNNAYQRPPSAPTQKERPVATSQNNVPCHGSRNACRCSANNANTSQNCVQYARREDYPFYAGPAPNNDAGGWQTWRCDVANRGQTAVAGGFDLQTAGWQQQDNSSPQTTCCLVVSNGQQTDGQHDAITATSQLDGTHANVDGNAAKLGVQSQRDRFPSRRQTCRLTNQASTAPAPEAPIPQPRVMHIAPPFEGITVNKGEFQDVKLSDYRGRYLCFFFYPLDFTFVCPTEIRAMSDLHDQFKEINCAILGCSCDSHFTHLAYIKTPKQNNGLGEIKFPLLSDFTKKISADYNVLTEDGTPLRALFIIDPVGIIRNITINDAGVGRNTDEVLRMVQAIKRVDDFDEMCPHCWVPGAVTIEPTRSGAMNYYRQQFSPKSDRKNEKQDAVDACSSHIDYEKEEMNML